MHSFNLASVSGARRLPYSLGLPGLRQSTAGAHKQFRDNAGRCTTVPFHSDRDIAPTLLRQIAKDIGLTVSEFLEHR